MNDRWEEEGGEQGGGSSVLGAVGVVFPRRVVTNVEPPARCSLRTSHARYQPLGRRRLCDAVGLRVSLLPGHPPSRSRSPPALPPYCCRTRWGCPMRRAPHPAASPKSPPELGLPHAQGSAPCCVPRVPSGAGAAPHTGLRALPRPPNPLRSCLPARRCGRGPSVLKKAPFQHLKCSFLTNKMFIF